MTEEAGSGSEYRALLLRLLDKIEDDVSKLDRQQADTEKTARAAFVRVEAAEDSLASLRTALADVVELYRKEIEKVGNEARASTISLAEIKAMSKTAGYLAGAVTGLLASVLTAFLMKLLNLS